MCGKIKNRQGSAKTLPIFFSCRPRFTTGFTLAELIIGLAIIGMLSGVTLLSISLLSTRQLDSDTRKFLADICWSREVTLSKHDNSTITIDTSNESYSITDSLGASIKPIQRLKVNISSAPNSITFQAPLASAVVIPSGTTVITLTAEGRQKQIGLRTETGYAKIE